MSDRFDGAVEVASRTLDTAQQPIEDADISVRTYNCAVALGIKNVGDFANYSEQELMRTHGFGRRSLNEVKSLLSGRELTLKLENKQEDIEVRLRRVLGKIDGHKAALARAQDELRALLAEGAAANPS